MLEPIASSYAAVPSGGRAFCLATWRGLERAARSTLTRSAPDGRARLPHRRRSATGALAKRLLPSVLVVLVVACTSPQRYATSWDVPLPEYARNAILVDALREFDLAMFHKPHGAAAAEIELAPLIVHEVTREEVADPRAGAFGAVGIDAQGVVFVDSELPTVYTASGIARIAGLPYDQRIFQWAYGSSAARQRRESTDVARDSGSGADEVPMTCAVRMTLGADGFPCVWEVWSDGDVDLLFVSASLERAAEARFGPPLSGRRYSIERAIDRAPRTVVARVLDDGPIPMGPYVYLDRAHRVTTLLCRCMASQMREVAETRTYGFASVDRLDVLGIARVASAERGSPLPRLLHPVPAGDRAGAWRLRPLDQRIRWPW